MKVQFILLILGFASLLSCTKNEQHPVPNIPFDLTIDISLPSYSSLMGVSGWAYVNNGGSKGIVVYRRGIEEFVAFDRHSPADELGVCEQPLVTDPDNFLQLNDSCNNATFSLYDGSPITNSVFGLRQYQVMWDGNHGLRIYN